MCVFVSVYVYVCVWYICERMDKTIEERKKAVAVENKRQKFGNSVRNVLSVICNIVCQIVCVCVFV